MLNNSYVTGPARHPAHAGRIARNSENSSCPVMMIMPTFMIIVHTVSFGYRTSPGKWVAMTETNPATGKKCTEGEQELPKNPRYRLMLRMPASNT